MNLLRGILGPNFSSLICYAMPTLLICEETILLIMAAYWLLWDGAEATAALATEGFGSLSLWSLDPTTFGIVSRPLLPFF